MKQDGLDLDAEVSGAVAGRKYGTENKGNKEAISKINDFAWLEETYKNAN